MPPAHVYVHVPFCARRCVYCDFSIAVRRTVPVDEYIAGVASELDLRFPAGQHGETSTLYFGGGTPSLLSPAQLEKILETIYQKFSVEAEIELTMEMNPATMTLETVKAC